jgi:hypothetical protein
MFGLVTLEYSVEFGWREPEEIVLNVLVGAAQLDA